MKRTNHIRIFISSTFRDMQNERDILVKKVFPRLRVEAEKRGLTFSYVDLRWGIVPNANPKEIIDVCLSEIENCDPFFIGLIGHNYGSIIPTINHSEEEVLENQHKGISLLLQKKLGYTELEMQYNLLISKERGRNLFYIKEGASSSCKSSNSGCLTTFIPKTLLKLNFMVEDNKQRNSLLEDLKFFILNNYSETTTYYPKDTTYNNSERLESIVFSDFMKIIGDYEIPQYLESKTVRYHQEAFLEKQKALIPRSIILKKMKEWVCQADTQEKDSTKLLLIKGEHGSGKTSVIAEYLNQKQSDIGLFYHFVGFSVKRETPELILHDLIAQVCSYLNIEERRYTGKETKYDLCKYLAQCIQNTTKKIVIFVDDLEAIECDTDSLMSIISWLPIGINNLRYIFSLGQNKVLFQKCPDWIQKDELLLEKLTPNECHEFSKKYLSVKYSKDISGEYGFRKKILTQTFYCRSDKQFLLNLGILKLFLDEVAMLDFGKEEEGLELVNQIEEKSKDIDVVLSLPFTRVEKEIFGKEEAKAIIILSFLAISNYGLYENDIITICSNNEVQLTQVDWSKLYCQIKPFIISDGYIKICEEMRNTIYSRYLGYKESLYKYRVNFVQGLRLLNVGNRYTMEIVYQYLKCNNDYELRRFLSSPSTITFLYNTNVDLLFESLKLLKAKKQTDSLIHELMASIDILNEGSRIQFYEAISIIFSEILPIYKAALEAIQSAISILEKKGYKTEEELRNLALDYLKQTELLTFVYRLGDAQKGVEAYIRVLSQNNKLSSDVTMQVKGMIAQANIYTHNSSTTEHIKAIPIYYDAIRIMVNKDDLNYIISLCSFLKLYVYSIHNNEDKLSLFNEYYQIMTTLVKEKLLYGTLSYYRALICCREIEYFALQLRGNKIEDFQNYCKELINNLHDYEIVYGKTTQETALFHNMIGYSYYHMSELYSKMNNYVEYVKCSDSAVQSYDMAANIIMQLYQTETKEYANALHEMTKAYLSFLETRPMEKEIICKRCLSWFKKEESVLKVLYSDGHPDLAKLYHNMSWVYKEQDDYDKAKLYIEKAIQMKRNFIKDVELSLYYSFIRKLIILKSEIVTKEIHKTSVLSNYEKQISMLLDFTNNLELSDQEKEMRTQKILQHHIWLDNWQNNTRVCYQEHARELFEVVKKMLKDCDSRRKDEGIDYLQLFISLSTKNKELISYISKHNLEASFENKDDKQVLFFIKNLLDSIGLSSV